MTPYHGDDRDWQREPGALVLILAVMGMLGCILGTAALVILVARHFLS